jgi:hypothetical protein
MLRCVEKTVPGIHGSNRNSVGAQVRIPACRGQAWNGGRPRNAYSRSSAVNPACAKCLSYVRASPMSWARMIRIDEQSVRLHCLS